MGPARTLAARRIAEPSAEASPSFLAIIRQRSALGAGLGHFCANYIFYFVLSWLPFYLVDVRGYSLHRLATIGGLPSAVPPFGPSAACPPVPIFPVPAGLGRRRVHSHLAAARRRSRRRRAARCC